MEKYPLQNTNITLVKHSLTSFILLCIALTIHQDVDVLLLHGSNFASLLAFLIWKCYLEHYEIYSVRLVGIFLSIMELLAVLQRKKNSLFWSTCTCGLARCVWRKSGD